MNDYQETINRNPVLKKMYDLASRRFGRERIIIRHVVPLEIVPDQTYGWQLFERTSDGAPVETVILDVSFLRKLEIDDEVKIELDRTRRSESSGE